MKKIAVEFVKVFAMAAFILALVGLVAPLPAQSPFSAGRGTFRGDVFSVLPFHLYQDTINTTSNCSGVGTAANPSVATCASSASGSFSCATNASAAANGCVVNTTAVTANSQIDVMEDSSLGTKLGVTCNTAVVSAIVSARTAGTSFSVTPGTITTNPACFSYTITN